MSALFIFRRDFRLQDNLALNELAKLNEKVIPLFIFDPSQLKDSNHTSKRAIVFMIESLKDLDQALRTRGSKLWITKGDPASVIDTILSQNKSIKTVAFNKDFSPYSVKRDNDIIKICEAREVKTITSDEDLVLHPYDAVLTQSNEPYTVFGSYYKKASLIKPPKPTTSKIDWSAPQTQFKVKRTTFKANMPT